VAAGDTRTVVAQIGRAIVDRTQWKMYNPELWFQGLFVQFEVPATEVVQDEQGNSIITLDGFALYVLDPFAVALENMHNAFKDREAKRAEEAYTKPKPNQFKQGEQ
jgi:hypothetical protein